MFFCFVNKLNWTAEDSNSRAVRREVKGNVWPGGEEQQILLRASGAAPAARAALQSFTLWSSHRTQQSWSHGLLPPNHPAKILFLSLPFCSLPFCQPNKLSQSSSELKEGPKQGQGGVLGRGSMGLLFPFACGSVLPNSWCSTCTQISWQELVIYPNFTLLCLGE